MTYRPLSQRAYETWNSRPTIRKCLTELVAVTAVVAGMMVSMKQCSPDNHKYIMNSPAAAGYDVEVIEMDGCRILRIGSLRNDNYPNTGFASAVVADKCNGEDGYDLAFSDDADDFLKQFATAEKFGDLEIELSTPTIKEE